MRILVETRCEHRTLLPVTSWPWPGQGERLRRGRGRARAPAGRRSRPGRSLSNASMPVSHRPPAARVAVAAPPRRRDYVSSPRRLASARRLTGVVATEATTPRRRVRHAAHRLSCGQKSGAATQRRPKSAVSKRAATTPVGKPRQLQLEGSPKPHDALDARTPARAGNHKGKRRKKKDARMPRGVAPVVAEAGPTAVKRSTARRSTAGSTAIREHAVTAVGIRTNETLRHTFRTGRRAAATRATHGRAGEAPPTVCQQPARVVRDESWDESWAPYYNLYAGTPRDSSGTNGASGCQPRNQDTQVHILRRSLELLGI